MSSVLVGLPVSSNVGLPVVGNGATLVGSGVVGIIVGSAVGSSVG